MEDAVSQWNGTGAFTFNITTDKKKADVIVSTMDNSSNQAAGLTQMSLDEATGYFVSGKLYLNRAYLLNPPTAIPTSESSTRRNTSSVT